jgi:hypothetical protein
MSAREAYIAGRSGGSRPPKQTSPSSTQGNTQQDREQSAYDAGQQERQRAETLANPNKGIGGLSQDERELARSIAEQTGKDPYGTEGRIAEGGKFITPEKTPTQKFDDFMTSFGMQNKINIPFPSIATFGASALEGMNATNVLLKKLMKGSELDSSDKVAVVTLVNKLRENNKINPSYDMDIANIIDNFAKENELSTDEMFDLTSKFNKQFAEIEGKVDKEDSNISDYIDRMNNMSFGETVGTMYGDLTGKRDTSGITTLENITDNLRSEGLAYLKLTDPKTFYKLRPAQTSEQMRDLANVAMPTGNSPEDRRFAAQIMEAREMAARSKESQDRASGIMTASSAPPVPPPVVPPVVPPGEDEVPENPILNPVMSQRDPFDLAKFYASLPQYTQQGVMSPNLMEYYRNLGLFPRA